MAVGDAEYWDKRWHEQWPTVGAPLRPPTHLVELTEHLPVGGTAIDLAGGAGTDACWFAEQGFEVTLADVSPVALQQAAEQAAALGLSLETLRFDADTDPVPSGPWQLAHIAHFLDRSLMDAVVPHVAPDGVLMIAVATAVNLDRHERPSRRFLLEPGELASWAGQRLDIVHASEGWRANDQHEAWLVARPLA